MKNNTKYVINVDVRTKDTAGNVIDQNAIVKRLEKILYNEWNIQGFEITKID